MSCHLLQKSETFDTIFSEAQFMILYDLFMLWIVGSISVIAASMVFGGLLCVWCAFKGRRRARLNANYGRLLNRDSSSQSTS